MDCEQIRDELDAYALGACEPHEVAEIETHLAGCAECRSALSGSQRAALAIALAVPLQQAPKRLRRRVMAEAAEPGRVAIGPARRLWPLGAGAFALGAAAALVFAIVLQAQVNDLEDENARLAVRAGENSERLTEQQEVLSVLAAEDVQSVALVSTQPDDTATAVYYWSRAERAGALIAHDVPQLGEGQAYHAWALTESETYWMGSFTSWDGGGALGMDLRELSERPNAIAVSIETAEATEPGEIYLLAEFGP